MPPLIPRIDVSALFDSSESHREQTDRRICDAACNAGFMTISGVPVLDEIGPEVRESLLRIFHIPEAEQREELLPGWRDDAARYFGAMETVGYALLASISRGLGIPENIFRDAFRDGISTLRLLRYPARDHDAPLAPELEKYFTQWNSERLEHVCLPHVDSGLVTILAQCDVAGLQAAASDGSWVEVPPSRDGLAINFGGLLARWTGGRVRATMHRVLSSGAERFSVPFFFEPRPDTVIAPLPLDGIEPFEPFQFGDHLWATTTKFPENFGLGHLRPHRAPYSDPFASQA